MEVEVSFNVKFFKLYLVGREAISWGNIGTFRSLKSYLTAEIFLAHELMGGVHNASVTRITQYLATSSLLPHVELSVWCGAYNWCNQKWKYLFTCIGLC
jgi:hypothetical protein